MAKKILIADDDEKIQFLLKDTLVKAGYMVYQAADGEEAMQIIRSQRPDLILLDLVMPTMHGYEVCRQIRADPNPEISGMKVVVISVKGYQSDIKTAEKIGADKYIIKPCSVQELLAVIGDLLTPPSPSTS